MKIHFFKYQATGNDFVIIDAREQAIQPERKFFEKICDRRFGIGADGVIFIQGNKETDFELQYYNPDGSSSLCGNGTRCAVHFAKKLGLIKGNFTTFIAYDGLHEAEFLNNGNIRLKMSDVQDIRVLSEGHYADTGSPHLVKMVTDLDSTDVITEGRALRYNTPIEGGVNVNFVEKKGENHVEVRTYERGVENETLSCGTGVTACALVTGGNKGPVKISTKGGELEVDFIKSSENTFSNIYLTGPAELVFEGTYDISN